MVRPKSARKFAHKRQKNEEDSEEKRAEARAEQEAPPSPMQASPPPQPIHSLLDFAAFKRIHPHPPHQEKTRTTREARVVLVRTVIPPEKKTDVPLKNVKIRRSGPSIADSVEIKNMKIISLRNRRILRPGVIANRVKDKGQASRDIKDSNSILPPRRTSKSTLPPRKTSNSTLPSRKTSNSTLPPRIRSNGTLPPRRTSNNTLPPRSTSNSKLPQRRTSNSTLPPRKTSNSTLPPRKTSNSTLPPRRTSNSTLPPRRTSNSTLPPRRTSNSTLPPRRTSNSTLPPRKTSNSTLPPRKTSNSTLPPRKNSNRTLPPRRTSDITEDNRPLTYFVKNAKLKNPVTNKLVKKRKLKLAEKQLTRKKRRETVDTVCKESEFRGFGASNHSPGKVTQSPSKVVSHGSNSLENPLSVESSSVKTTEKIGTRSRTQRNISAICNPPSDTNELEPALPAETPSGSLAKFIIDLINWNEKTRPEFDTESLSTIRSVTDMAADDNTSAGFELETETDAGETGLSRVREWLAKTTPPSPPPTHKNVRRAQHDNQFKVPETPLWRRHPPTAGSKSAARAPLTPRELALRKLCTAWSFDNFSNIQFHPGLIKQFCGECTRCRVLFKPMDPLAFGSPADIYEFNDANVGPVAPYRGARTEDTLNETKPIFVNISEHKDYYKKIKECMTEHGRLIHRVVILTRDRLNKGVALSLKDETVTAKVIGMLIESNSGVENSRRRPATGAAPVLLDSGRLLATPSVMDPSPSTSREGLEVIPRKRARACSEAATNLDYALRESRSFTASDHDFAQSPVKFTSRLLQKYPGLGLCGITPPASFTPTCDINDAQSSFKVSNLYIHRMLQRWSPLTRELSTIRSLQDPKTQQSPLFAGLEVDLVKLFHTVQDEKGIEAVNSDVENWEVVKQRMGLYFRSKIKTKLQNIYFKYLLGYNSLTSLERDTKNGDMESCWKARQQQAVARSLHPLYRQARMRRGLPCHEEHPTRMELACAEAEDCVTNGRSCDLKTFTKLAQQVQNTYFPKNPNPSPEEVEVKFWDIVKLADAHVCVHSASVDTSEHGYGFPADRSAPCGDHPWNLKRLGLSSLNLLSYLGPTPGVSSTSLQFGMTFSASCWHMDPTKVPYIEYLHKGPPKIWYSISAEQNESFRQAAADLCPFAVLNKDIWLPCDMTLIPPAVLLRHGVRVTRHVQRAGTFVVVYPNTYCACVSTGYTVSEGAYFAPHVWINTAESIYLNLRNNCEPSLFSLDKLLIAIAENKSTHLSMLQRVHAMLDAQLSAELSYRRDLADRNIELITPQDFQAQNRRTSWAAWQIQEAGECAYCRCHIVLSRVIGVTEGQTGVCAEHGVHLYEHAVARRVQLPNVYCIVLVTNERINQILENIRTRLRDASVTDLVPRGRANK